MRRLRTLTHYRDSQFSVSPCRRVPASPRLLLLVSPSPRRLLCVLRLFVINSSRERSSHMRIALITLINLSLCVVTTAVGGPPSAKSAAEQEIRAALCEIDQHAYAAARARIERLLQTDPANVDAQKVRLGILAAQIKPGDTSPENITLIRNAIAAYQDALQSPQLTADEKDRIDKFVVLLYGRIGRDEQRQELERRSIDPKRDAKDRSSAYTVLASQSWDCSFKLTELPEVKLVVNNGNQSTVTYKKPAAQKDFDSAQACVKRGLDEAESAIKLDPDNENAWSYKTNLLLEAAKLAEMEGDQTRKAAFRKQSDEANKITSDLSTKHQAEAEKEWARKEQEQKDADSSKPADAEESSAELVEFKREGSLAEAIRAVFIPDLELTTLVAPIPIPQEKTESASTTVTRPKPKGCFLEVDGPAQVQEKRNWKTFAPADEEYIVDLPDNVCKGNGGGYLAASEGVMYSIISFPRPAIASSPIVVDAALNAMARTFASMRSSAWLNGGVGNSFELKLLRKETVTGQPHKLYSYSQVSCQLRKENVLLIQATKSHYYTIDINGATEQDPRVQRLLSSLKVK